MHCVCGVGFSNEISQNYGFSAKLSNIGLATFEIGDFLGGNVEYLEIIHLKYEKIKIFDQHTKIVVADGSI